MFWKIVFSVVLLFGPVGVSAGQEPELSDSTAIPKAPKPSQVSDQQKDDLREAIYENLNTTTYVSPQKDEEAGEPKPDEDEASQQWYEKHVKVANNLQNLPEHLPVLAGKNWVHFGRIEAEYGRFSDGVLQDSTGFNLRSLRGGLVRVLNKHTSVKFEIDLTDGDSNWADLYARFNSNIGVFTIGNQQIAQTLVNQTSRLANTFMELPIPSDAFGLGRRLGTGWDYHLKKGGTHLTVFAKDLNENIGKLGYGYRAYFNPTKTHFKLLHLGISAVQEKMDRDARYRAYPESKVTDIRLVDTGSYTEVDTQTIIGLELASAKGAFSVRGEYMKAKWEGRSIVDHIFNGFYVQANWAITGEQFQYAQGKFLRLRPKGSRAAWEVAVRYSEVDLNNLDVLGGEEENISLALNWYSPGNQLRLMSNLILVETDAVAGDENTIVFQLRAQMNW